ncbi:MAG: Smr/MutS family protein [Deltaproteobacteria bacterium]|nr:Smr/MutS family protein [Deltaproteobacteria bacterium]
MNDETLFPEKIELPIEGELDLHTFRPQDAASLVDEYLRVCAERGIYEVKIIHGKGKGVLLHTVQALLRKHPCVMNFTQDSGHSGWGATTAYLKKEPERKKEGRSPGNGMIGK